MKKLMHTLFLSCLKATELIEKKIYFRLTLKQKIQLKAHKAMCSACSNYEKQSRFMDQALKYFNNTNGSSKDLSELKKETLIKIKNLEQN